MREQRQKQQRTKKPFICPCHKMYKVEADGLSFSVNFYLKIDILSMTG